MFVVCKYHIIEDGYCVRWPGYVFQELESNVITRNEAFAEGKAQKLQAQEEAEQAELTKQIRQTTR